MRILLTILFLSCQLLNGQEWVEMMKSSNANFYEIQAKYYQDWSQYKDQKSKGHKAFKRWEYFWESRVLPDGSFPSKKLLWDAYHNQKLKSSVNADESNWEPLGPTSWNAGTGWNPGNGRINAIAQSPQDTNIIYVGSPSGGLWKSEDHGENWSILSNDIPVQGVSGIAIHPENDSIIYISTGDFDGGDTYSLGVLKSLDAGASWDTTGLSWNISNQFLGGKIAFHPIHHDIIFVCSNNGLFRSDDLGDSWTKILNGSVNDIEFKYGSDSTIFVSTNAFYKSDNLGNDFESIDVPVLDGVNRMLIAVNQVDSIVYCLTGQSSDSGFEGLYKSTDGGNSFTTIRNDPNYFGYEVDASDEGGQSWYDMGFAIDPVNPDEIYIGGVNVFRSLDGGESFYIKSHWIYPNNHGYTHADIHSIEFIGNTLYVGSDGGVFMSKNKGEDFINLSFGLNIMQFYAMSNVPDNSEIILAGAQDNGVNAYSNGAWKHFLGADGMESLINPEDPNNYFGSTQNGSIYYTNDGGLTYEYTDDLPEGAPWVTRMEIDAAYSELIYAGGNKEVWVWDGQGWIQLSNFTFSQSGVIKAIKSLTADKIIAAKSKKIFITEDYGTTWENITSNLPVSGNSISYLDVNPDNHSEIWVALSSYSDKKVYFTDDRGASWTNISKDLPSIPVNCVQYVKGSDGGIYVATDMGVYYTDNTLEEYIPWMKDLPSVVVTELTIDQGANKIRASTYGRGLWESDLYIPDTGGASINNPDFDNRISTRYNGSDIVISFQFEQKTALDLIVYNQLGQPILYRNIEAKYNQVQIPIKRLAKGIYFCTYKSNGFIITQPVVIN